MEHEHSNMIIWHTEESEALGTIAQKEVIMLTLKGKLETLWMKSMEFMILGEWSSLFVVSEMPLKFMMICAAEESFQRWNYFEIYY